MFLIRKDIKKTNKFSVNTIYINTLMPYFKYKNKDGKYVEPLHTGIAL